VFQLSATHYGLKVKTYKSNIKIMNNKIVFGIGGIMVGLVLAFVFVSPSSGFRNGIGMMGNNRIATNNSQIASAIDSHFIEQMIPHHEGAISMSNLALKKAKHQEIKTLATAIIAGQTKEIDDMRSWYGNWFGKNVSKVSTGIMEGGMMSGNGMHMGGQEDMTALENASDFDKVFIEQMIPHHQLAIMMAQMLRSGTNRPEMKQLAENIITSQSKEIQEMQTWYKQWYQ
jgi:uncharacterized protein (DUF305 family)